MGTATLTLPEDIKSELKRFSWINWSEVAKEELLKKEKKQELLKKLDKFIQKRKLIAKQYNKGLGGIPEITLPYEKNGIRHAWHIYTILLDKSINRDEFFNLMRKKKI